MQTPACPARSQVTIVTELSLLTSLRLKESRFTYKAELLRCLLLQDNINLKLTCMNIRTFYSVQVGWRKTPRFLQCSICRSRVVSFSLRPTYHSTCNSINNKSINLIHRKWAEFTGPMTKCKSVQVFWLNVPRIRVITRVSESYLPSVFQISMRMEAMFFFRNVCANLTDYTMC